MWHGEKRMQYSLLQALPRSRLAAVSWVLLLSLASCEAPAPIQYVDAGSHDTMAYYLCTNTARLAEQCLAVGADMVPIGEKCFTELDAVLLCKKAGGCSGLAAGGCVLCVQPKGPP